MQLYQTEVEGHKKCNITNIYGIPDCKIRHTKRFSTTVVHFTYWRLYSSPSLHGNMVDNIALCLSLSTCADICLSMTGVLR